jgi:hypothetical protein
MLKVMVTNYGPGLTLKVPAGCVVFTAMFRGLTGYY